MHKLKKKILNFYIKIKTEIHYRKLEKNIVFKLAFSKFASDLPTIQTLTLKI